MFKREADSLSKISSIDSPVEELDRETDLRPTSLRLAPESMANSSDTHSTSLADKEDDDGSFLELSLCKRLIFSTYWASWRNVAAFLLDERFALLLRIASKSSNEVCASQKFFTSGMCFWMNATTSASTCAQLDRFALTTPFAILWNTLEIARRALKVSADKAKRVRPYA